MVSGVINHNNSAIKNNEIVILFFSITGSSIRFFNFKQTLEIFHEY